MKKNTFTLVLAMAVLLAACSTNLSVVRTSTVPVVANSPTLTSLPGSPTVQSGDPVSTATPTSEPTAQPGSQCLGLQAELPSDIEGQFVLEGGYYLDIDPSGFQTHYTTPYLLDPKKGTKIELPTLATDDEIIAFSVSPDRKRLAYETRGIDYNIDSGVAVSKYSRLVVVSNQGVEVKSYSKEEKTDWANLIGWLDNTRLMIVKSPQRYGPHPLILLNVDNGEEKELEWTYPDKFVDTASVYWWGKYTLPLTVYNADLSLVAYPQGGSVVLWDLQSQQVIASVKVPWGRSHAPLWLPDDRQFIINMDLSDSFDSPPKEELASVSADSGEIKQLTHLLDAYEYINIGQYSASTDGRYIAIWFQPTNSEYWAAPPARPLEIADTIYHLAIYDTVAQQTQLYCVQTIAPTYEPVWAPAENQLLVGGFLDNPNDYGTVFIDLDTGKLASVEKSRNPVGWMLEP